MNAVSIPAVCGKCQILFPSGVEVGGSDNVILGTFARCPHCRSRSPILDGVYNNIGGSLECLLREKGRETLQRLADLLREAQEAGLLSDEVASKIERDAPELSSLKDWLPKTRNELYVVFGLILLIIKSFMSPAGDCVSKDDVQGYVDAAVRQAYKAQVRPHIQSQNVVVNINPEPRAGRNSPCPCGSGRKFKKCCGKGK